MVTRRGNTPGRSAPPGRRLPTWNTASAADRGAPGSGAGRASVPAAGADRMLPGRARVPQRPAEPPPARTGGRGGPPGGTPPPALVQRRRGPRWRRIALVGLLVLALVAGLGAGALALYGRSLESNMSRVDAFTGVDERPTKPVGGTRNILLLGSDSRDPDGEDGPYRADTIMLLHIPSGQDEAYLISIPRDLWVYVPPNADGTAGGHEAKVNAATAYGGVPLAVETVEQYTGVRIDNVMMVDFGGFVEVTDALGGVEMDIEQTITSIHGERRVFEEGTQHLDGEEALDYIRQRYQFADGDFARMRNQQQFLRALMDKAASGGTLSNPSKLNAFLQTATSTLTVDEEFGLLGVGWQFRNLRSDNLHFMTSPHLGTGWAGGQSVVLSDDDGAAVLYQAVRDDRVAEWANTHAGNND